MSIRVKELDKMIDEPQAPASYSRPAIAAWDRGVRHRAWHPRPSAERNPYTRRYMRRAWLAGFDAMNKIVTDYKAMYK